MNELRRELHALLLTVQTGRPPAVRRSRREEWLYATDLPQTADPSATACFAEAARKAGWRVCAEAEWLLLDKYTSVPPTPWISDETGPEARCCLSLLRRHTDRLTPSDGTAERALIKAAEAGPGKFGEACRKIHEQWAERMRRGQSIPDIHPDFFRGGKERC